MRANEEVVEAWSTVRLPFEPKGWLRDLREALRTGLRDIRPKAGHVLHATYQSVVRSRVDAENVLLYNVGVGAATHLSALGVRFDRGYDPPPAPDDRLAPTPLHYVRYAQERPEGADKPFGHGLALARFEEVPASSLSGAAVVFFAVRRHGSRPQSVVPYGGQFGVAIRLRRPSSSAARPVTILKTLLDGVISAYHAHEGPLQPVSERLSAAGFGDDEAVAGVLGDPRWNVLGGRDLVRPYRTGVMWNPGDDRCLGAEVMIDGEAPGTHWLMRGEIISDSERF